MKSYFLKKSIDPSYEEVRSLRHALNDALIYAKIDEPLRNKVLICYSEIVTNFIEHGLDTKNVNLIMDFSGGQLQLKLEVVACQNDHDKLVDWLTQEDSLDELDGELEFMRSGGRGGFLVNSQCSDIRVIPPKQHSIADQIYWDNGFILAWSIKGHGIPAQILVVEDERSVNALLCQYLSQDFTALPAYSGEEALAILSCHRVDLVLSDMNMPFKNGLELRQSLSQDTSLSALPFILISGETTHVQACSRLGIDDFLQKPIGKQKLLGCVSRTLARNQQLQRDMQNRIYGRIHGSLQASLPSELAGWRFGLKATSNLHGGGDLLLWEHRGSSILIILADVMGHDEASKFFSHAYRGYIRGFLSAKDELPRPAEFLQKLSDGMHQDHLLNHCLCTSVAILLESDGSYSISSAGHPESYIVSTDTTTIVEAGGMLPGLCPNIVYNSNEGRLNSAERLVLSTDGLYDEREQSNADDRQKQVNIVLSSLQQDLNQPIQRSCDDTFKLAIDQQAQALDDALLLLIERGGDDSVS